MTNLEKALAAGLVIVGTYAVGLTVETIKYVNRNIKFCKEIQEKTQQIRNMLEESENEDEIQ